MIGFCILGIIINTFAAIFTGCTSVNLFMNGNFNMAFLELVLCLANIGFFIGNSLNLKKEISSKRH